MHLHRVGIQRQHPALPGPAAQGRNEACDCASSDSFLIPRAAAQGDTTPADAPRAGCGGHCGCPAIHVYGSSSGGAPHTQRNPQLQWEVVSWEAARCPPCVMKCGACASGERWRSR